MRTHVETLRSNIRLGVIRKAAREIATISPGLDNVSTVCLAVEQHTGYAMSGKERVVALVAYDTQRLDAIFNS